VADDPRPVAGDAGVAGGIPDDADDAFDADDPVEVVSREAYQRFLDLH
jgi:hypothetical protein